MRIKKPIYLSPVRPVTAAQLADVVSDSRHRFALAIEPGKSITARPVAQTAVEPGLVLKAVSSNSNKCPL